MLSNFLKNIYNQNKTDVSTLIRYLNGQDWVVDGRSPCRWLKNWHHARNYRKLPEHGVEEYGYANDLMLFLMHIICKVRRLVLPEARFVNTCN